MGRGREGWEAGRVRVRRERKGQRGYGKRWEASTWILSRGSEFLVTPLLVTVSVICHA